MKRAHGGFSLAGLKLPVAIALVAIGFGIGATVFAPSPAPKQAETAPLTPPNEAVPVPVPDLAGVTVVSPAAAAVIPEPETVAAPQPYDRLLRVGKGDTLMKMLVAAGIPRNEAHAAITAMAKVYSPRKIKPGQEITLTFEPGDAVAETISTEATGDRPDRFSRMVLTAGLELDIAVERQDKGFGAEKVLKPLSERFDRATGTIQTSLYVAAVDGGMPLPILMEMIRAYSWDVDFQRDIQPGDSFEVMYNAFDTQSGETARYGDVHYAKLVLSGKEYPIYRYKLKDGAIDYFDHKGRGAKKALMRTPINGARLSSGYGRRKHPILGYTKKHTGIDFAAPTGTPIFAAGDGVIDYIGRKGGYGKYVRLRHNSEYKTAYAHMSRYKKGLRKGARVRQGQVIGYVGSTGRSTGPHLHYEILRKDRHTNPLRVKMPSGRKLTGKTLAAFQTERSHLDGQFAALPVDPAPVAQNDAAISKASTPPATTE